MDQTQFFLRMFKYDDWANRGSLASLKAAGAQARPLKVMSHLIAAQRLWLERLKQEKQSMATWPELSLQECEAHLADLAPGWRDYLSGLGPDDYTAEISYTNTKGEPWTNTVEDTLTHLLLHSAQHRGQIALDLRASGQTPAYTDFIEALRRGILG
ncbi:MAG TPA: DinB family protein [Blastocatellia bacterium]|jgi:uncharacterized damage-inducible protein DinB|nr:DinB family protein [Blastocatellia bacterium]